MLRTVSKEDSLIRLSQDGRWFHAGEPFTNQNVARFFHKAIRKDETDNYYLHNRYSNWEEHVYFEVEDTAYFVQDLMLEPTGRRFHILLNTEAVDILDVRTLEEDQRGVMYCRVLGGDRARFSQRALAQLGDYAKEDECGIYVEETGEKVYISGKNSPPRL